MRHAGRAVFVLVAVLLLANAFAFFSSLLSAPWVPQEISFPEGQCAYGARQAANGLPVYDACEQWPHRYSPYGPLFYYPVGWLAAAFGELNFGQLLYGIGRSQSLLYLLGTCVLIFLGARRLGSSRLVATAFGIGSFALWSDILIWAASYRPDLPALFWSFLGFTLATAHHERRPKWLAEAGGGLCFIVALLYKSNSFNGPIALTLLLWRTRGLRHAVSWFLAFVGASAAALASANALTGGMFIYNVLFGAGSGMTFEPLRRVAEHFTQYPQIGVLLRTLLASIAGATLLKQRDEAASPFAVYFFVSLFVSTAQLGRMGPDLNYLIEAFTISTVLLARSVQDLSPLPTSSHHRRRVVYAAIIFFSYLPLPSHLLQSLVSLKFAATLVVTPQKSTYHSAPATDLLMNLAFDHPNPDTHAVPDAFYYMSMQNRGRVPIEPFRSRLEARQFGRIVMQPAIHHMLSNTPGKWFDRTLNQNYRRVDSQPEVEIWIRR